MILALKYMEKLIELKTNDCTLSLTKATLTINDEWGLYVSDISKIYFEDGHHLFIVLNRSIDNPMTPEEGCSLYSIEGDFCVEYLKTFCRLFKKCKQEHEANQINRGDLLTALNAKAIKSSEPEIKTIESDADAGFSELLKGNLEFEIQPPETTMAEAEQAFATEQRKKRFFFFNKRL